MEYNIKYGVLKGQKVSEAFSNGKYKELLELKEFLLNSFSGQNDSTKEIILNGILTIDYYFSIEYSKKITEFCDKFKKLSKEKRQTFNIDLEKLKNNDLIEMNNYLKQIG